MARQRCQKCGSEDFSDERFESSIKLVKSAGRIGVLLCVVGVIVLSLGHFVWGLEGTIFGLGGVGTGILLIICTRFVPVARTRCNGCGWEHVR